MNGIIAPPRGGAVAEGIREAVGLCVRHDAYGKGVITSAEGAAVTVSFAEGEKRFVFPDAFLRHLTFTDKSKQRQMSALLSGIERERRRRAEEAEEERARVSRLEGFKVLGNSQAAFRTEDAAKALREWRVSTGRYLSGGSTGKPRVPDKLRPNSACLITALPRGMGEHERRIVGAFMVKRGFFGDECADGVIEAHEEHRIALREGAFVSFWDYFPRASAPRWGASDYKYFSNLTMLKMLSDMLSAAAEEEKKKISEFYKYFRKLNNLYELAPHVNSAE